MLTGGWDLSLTFMGFLAFESVFGPGIKFIIRLPVIRTDSFNMMTVYSHDKLVNDGLEEGAMAVLTKPLDINVLFGFFSTLRKELR